MERRTRFSKQLFQQAHASELHSSNFRGCHPCICHSTKLEFIVQVTGYPSINIRALAMCMGPDYAFRFSEIGIIILLSWEAHGRTIARPSSVRGSDTTEPARAQSRLAPAPPVAGTTVDSFCVRASTGAAKALAYRIFDPGPSIRGAGPCASPYSREYGTGALQLSDSTKFTLPLL
jgi:hypothetical protein